MSLACTLFSSAASADRGGSITSPGGGRIDASNESDEWIASIDGKESYRFPMEVLAGD